MAAFCKEKYHAGLQPYCDICSHPMEVLDRYVLLAGDRHTTAFSYRLGPYIFPKYVWPVGCESGTLRLHYQKPNFVPSAYHHETSTVHFDCLEFISQRCNIPNLLDYLWVATAWRTPWRTAWGQAPYFRLKDALIEPDWPLFDDIGLSMLRLLPLEILEIIHKYSATSIFWRFHSASSFTRQLSSITPSEDILSIPLSTVSQWKRGSRPLTADIDNALPLAFLTIDSWGINEITRLAEKPQFKAWRTDRCRFLILDQAQLEGITAYFKFGFLRLKLPVTCHRLQTWDTPTPPSLRPFPFDPKSIASSTEFNTIDLRQTNGITFFFSPDSIYAMHPHTKMAPCAQTTYERLSSRVRFPLTWIYVPLPQKDSIVSLIAQTPIRARRSSICSSLLLRMKLAGDVPINFFESNDARTLLLCESPPTTIVYGTDEHGQIFIVGACSTETESISPITLPSQSFVANPTLTDRYFSSAPLENVDHIRIFNDEEDGFCKGILLQYQNGAQRSLGQCRLGVDPVEDCIKPATICLRPKSYCKPGITRPLQVAIVKASSTQDHEHSEEGLECFEMKGELRFWFYLEKNTLRVVGGQKLKYG